MTVDALTSLLAERVMHWGVGPDRFLVGNRRWMPSWRFQPTKKVEDAFRLLEAADPEEYRITARRGRGFNVWVKIGGIAGEASGTCKARAITHAVARAIGIQAEIEGPATVGVDGQ